MLCVAIGNVILLSLVFMCRVSSVQLVAKMNVFVALFQCMYMYLYDDTLSLIAIIV